MCWLGPWRTSDRALDAMPGLLQGRLDGATSRSVARADVASSDVLGFDAAAADARQRQHLGHGVSDDGQLCIAAPPVLLMHLPLGGAPYAVPSHGTVVREPEQAQGTVEGGGCQGMQVVITSLRILEAVAARQPVGVSELARSLDLPKTTVQRGLKALESAGWIRLGEGQPTRWVLTAKPLAMARHTSARGGLREAVMAAMERLREETQETIHLAVLEADRMVLVERLDSPMVVRSSYPLGFSSPVHASSTGKAYLSRLDVEEIEALLPADLARFTDTTIGSRAALLREIAEVRSLGYACNRGELRPEIGSVAAAICNAAGRPEAAVSISAPINRIPADAWARLGGLVAETAAGVTLP